MLKISIRVGLLTALAILLYLAGNQLLIHRYIQTDVYLAALVLTALATGMTIAQQKSPLLPKTELDQLTAKEMQILMLIAEGKTNKEIAAANFVEMSTVKTHINNIYGKLSVTNRKDAIKTYQQYQTAKSTLSPPAIS